MADLSPWIVEATELVLDNEWARVRRDICRLPGGATINDYYYWEGGDFAQVLPLTTTGEVVLVRQYKHGVRRVVLELPAGMVSASDADPLATAQRELREETGFEAPTWLALASLDVSSAKATTRAHCYLARDAVRVGDPSPDHHEEIEVVVTPVAKLLELVEQGIVVDSNSLATCLLGLRRLGRLASIRDW